MRSVTRLIGVFSFVAILGAGKAFAGPVIIDGTDANDHGSTNGVANFNGWEYMQRALENLASEMLAANPAAPQTVLALGLAGGSGTQADAAYTSAFSLGIGTTGWSSSVADGAAAITAALAAISTASTSILYIPTFGNPSGDLAATELAAINAAAAQIAAFVNAGGALFAMGESGADAWGWLTTLLPGLIVTDIGGGGIGTNMTLTAAGTTAFPGLTDAELANADPWHNYFSGDLGSLQVLATAPDNAGVTRNIILGGGRGTVIQPTIPEPATLLLFGSGLAGLYRRRMRKAQA